MIKKNSLNRRQFIKTSVTSAGALSISSALTGCLDTGQDEDKSLTVFVFGHGVASGDPLSDSVIIWTRVTPDVEEGTVAKVAWVVAEDKAMQKVVASGTEYTSGRKDFTVKVDVKNLKPNTEYYYQFAGNGGALSTQGRTKTLPVGKIERVKIAACSCANFPAGLFNVYEDMAASDADVVLHLGDYIYEYGSNKYPSQDAAGRVPDPLKEIISLGDYRRRYQQYRIDPDLQAAHAAKPFICVWDDHEITNDAYVSGAQNHDPSEGDYNTRRNAAVQAYHEWLPIRTGEDKKDIYRSFEFGDLVSLYMLETRLLARTKQIEFKDYMTEQGMDVTGVKSAINAPDRTLLGDTQKAALTQGVKESNTTWQVLGQQLLMGRMEMPVEMIAATQEVWVTLFSGGDTAPALAKLKSLMTELVAIKSRILQGIEVSDQDRARIQTVIPYNLDAWDGYMAERDELLSLFQQEGKNLVVLAGDTHNGWANDLCPSGSDTSVGVEFAASSVSSPGMEGYLGLAGDPVGLANFEYGLVTLLDHLKYVNAKDRGYVIVDFTPEKAVCSWHYIDTVASKPYKAIVKKQMQVLNGQTQLQDV